jgi:hypothetical protein
MAEIAALAANYGVQFGGIDECAGAATDVLGSIGVAEQT